eukprot:6304175-Karenia_brevis.AAC.1
MTQGAPKKSKMAGDAEMQEVIKVIAKSCLSSAQQVRIHKGILMWCARMQAENKFVKAAKYAVSQYEELIKTQKEAEGMEVLKEKLGVPAVHCWNALIQELLKDPQGTMTAMQAEAVKTAMKDWSWKAVLDAVPHCKIAKMYGQEYKRVEIASPEDHGLLD